MTQSSWELHSRMVHTLTFPQWKELVWSDWVGERTVVACPEHSEEGCGRWVWLKRTGSGPTEHLSLKICKKRVDCEMSS